MVDIEFFIVRFVPYIFMAMSNGAILRKAFIKGNITGTGNTRNTVPL